MARVRPAAFLGLQTSPGSYQAWIAISETEDKDFARRLRKGMGADDSASGATRVAGSINFKEKYAPELSRVEILYSTPGLFATKEQLSALGLVAAPEVAAPALHRVSLAGLINRKWPSYQRCLEGAPPNHGIPAPTAAANAPQQCTPSSKPQSSTASTPRRISAPITTRLRMDAHAIFKVHPWGLPFGQAIVRPTMPARPPPPLQR